MDFAQMVLSRLEDLGLNINQAEQAHGFPEGYIRGVVRQDDKRATPSITKADSICRALGIDFHIGLPRPVAVPGLSDSAASPALALSDAARLGYAPMPWHDEARRKGPVPLAFSRAWMEQQHLVPDNLRIVVPDDVRIPGAGQGATVALIDAAARRPAGPALWCYSQLGRSVLADIQGSAKVIVIRAQDRTRGDIILSGAESAAIRILGRVVWWGTTEPAPSGDK